MVLVLLREKGCCSCCANLQGFCGLGTKAWRLIPLTYLVCFPPNNNTVSQSAWSKADRQHTAQGVPW